MFCYYLLGGNTAVPSELYARLCHSFLVDYIMQICWLNVLKLKKDYNVFVDMLKMQDIFPLLTGIVR